MSAVDRRPAGAFTGPVATGVVAGALVAGPLVVAELVLLITGRAAAIGRVERRIAGRLPASPGGEADQWSMVTAAVAIYVPFRSGQQVFAALDPDLTRDAWGGPSYVGASLAHWLDGILLFCGCTVLIAWDRKISTDDRRDDQVVPQPPRHHVAR